MYNVCYVGFGPSTIFSVLRLVELNYKGNILIIEKGKSLHTRPKTEAVYGSGGASCFSDFKISSALDVGGIIPDLTQKGLENFEKWFLKEINKYCEDTLDWQVTTEYPIPSNCSLTWNRHKTLHVGSDRGSLLCTKIEDYLASKTNITFKWEEEVTLVNKLEHGFVINTTQSNYIADKVIIATGRFGLLPSEISYKNKFTEIPRPLQLGIRVNDITNPQYEEIIKANYDFKFVKEYNFDKIHVRVRTFCCNSSRAKIAKENHVKEQYVSFNGHALHKGPTNPSVNYGIVAAVSGLDPWFYVKEHGSELMQKINNTEEFKCNFSNFDTKELGEGRNLLDDFSSEENNNLAIKIYYPKEVRMAMFDFIKELSKVVNLSKAKYYFPEWKASASHPLIDKYGKAELKGLYYIGDCCNTGSIIKAAYCGYKLAEVI